MNKKMIHNLNKEKNINYDESVNPTLANAIAAFQQGHGNDLVDCNVIDIDNVNNMDCPVAVDLSCS